MLPLDIVHFILTLTGITILQMAMVRFWVTIRAVPTILPMERQRFFLNSTGSYNAASGFESLYFQ
jgi:hypothetical protein